MIAILFLTILISKLASSQVCETCQNLVIEFHAGLKDSEKGNFGGGNTAWEEERLGNFATSETRLVHIVDGLCPSKISNREKCQYLREELEEQIEKWWFKVYKVENKADSLYQYLCIDHLRACCPNNHYGKSCDICPNLDLSTGLMCSGHGNCKGNGTRDGDGSCLCENGYSGSICDSCATNHYRGSVDTCHQCNEACNGCKAPLSTDCEQCANGWIDESGDCVDVDECHLNSSLCSGANQYCVNTAGSYRCVDCDRSCDRCSGSSNKDCVMCSQGYQSVQGVCSDVNECSADSQLCRDPGQRCTNTEGSYSCDCEKRYQRQSDGSCKLIDIPGKRQSSSSTDDSDDTDRAQRINTNNNKNKKRQTKKIWTRRFEREFFKLIVVIVVLGAVSYWLGRYSLVVMATGVACGYYVYHKSIRLDLIFSKSFYV